MRTQDVEPHIRSAAEMRENLKPRADLRHGGTIPSVIAEQWYRECGAAPGTAEFLAYSKYVGNDLSTPRPEFGFAGLKPGDRWCLCASRFLQAADEGCAPLVSLEATHVRALDMVPLALLQSHDVASSTGSDS
mgnify:CR=1 FL=1